MKIDPKSLEIIQALIKFDFGITMIELLGEELYDFITGLEFSTDQEVVSTYNGFHKGYLNESVNGGNEGESSTTNVENLKGKGKQEDDEFPPLHEAFSRLRISNGRYSKRLKKIPGEASTSYVHGRNEGQPSNPKAENLRRNGTQEVNGEDKEQESNGNFKNGEDNLNDKWGMQRIVEIAKRLPSAVVMDGYGSSSEDEDEEEEPKDPPLYVDKSEYRTTCRNHFENWMKKKEEEQEAISNVDPLWVYLIDRAVEEKNKNPEKPRRRRK